jgi:colicin import membrane protein
MTVRFLTRFLLLAAVVAGTGLAQPEPPAGGAKGKGGKPAEANPAADALRDELDLLQAQTRLKALAATAAAERAKVEEGQLKRLEGIGAAISATDIAKQKLAVSAARVEAEARSAELAEHEVRVRVTKRKLDAAVANPPKAGGPNATEESLAKLVQLMAERNATEKEWIAKESARLAYEARRQKEVLDEERQRRVKEEQSRQDEAKAAQTRARMAEEQMRAEMQRRMDAEAERLRAEKAAMLKRLPGELADAELRIRAADLKHQQMKLELEVVARELERQKAARAHLEELKATLEKELKPRNDK